MKIHIKNGRLIDPASKTDKPLDVFIAAGRIVGVGHTPAGFEPKWVPTKSRSASAMRSVR